MEEKHSDLLERKEGSGVEECGIIKIIVTIQVEVQVLVTLF